MALKFSRLDRTAIRALRRGEKLTEHGITAERLANGDVRYSINIMADGERIHRVIGRESEGVTRQQAEDAIEVWRTKAREQRLDLPTGRKLHREFSEAADEYIERLEQTGGKNLGPKRRHFKNSLKPYFGSDRLDRISDFNILKYRKHRSGEGVKPSTINREIATLRHFLKKAAEWKWISKDKLPEIQMAPEPQGAKKVLTDTEAAALMKGAIDDQDGRTWLFVAFGLNAAMRHREILAVRYDQIDFAHRRIFIPEAKAGEREQPITKALADMLAKQRKMEDDPDGWIFPAGSRVKKTPHRTRMDRQFARAVIRAGMEPSQVTPHTMRRTAITRLVKAKVDLPTIQRISGHKTLAALMRYVAVHDPHIDDAIDHISMSISDAITPELHMPSHAKA